MGDKQLEPHKRGPREEKLKRRVDDFGPLIAMTVITLFVILVVAVILIPDRRSTIVVRSVGGPVDFDATSALVYAERVARIAEITVGGVLTLALGLVGFSWLSNNARIERDRQELAEHKNNLDKQLNERLTRETTRMNLRVRTLTSRLNSLRDELKEEREARLRTEISPRTSELQTLATLRNMLVHGQLDRFAQRSISRIYASLLAGKNDRGFELFVDHLDSSLEELRTEDSGFIQPALIEELRSDSHPLSIVADRLPAELLELIDEVVPAVATSTLANNEQNIYKAISQLRDRFRRDRTSLDEASSSRLDNIVSLLLRIDESIRQRLEANRVNVVRGGQSDSQH